MSFFLEKLFCNFIRTQIYKCLSNPQHESCDLGPNTSKVPKFSIYTVYIYTVSAANCTCKKERRRKERMRNWNVTTWGKIRKELRNRECVLKQPIGAIRNKRRTTDCFYDAFSILQSPYKNQIEESRICYL